MNFIFISNVLSDILVAESFGIGCFMIDLEIEGKFERQGHKDTLISKHNIEDIECLSKNLLHTSEIIARINPLSAKSRSEIDAVISAGAKSIMLPMFKNHFEVSQFLELVDNRAKTILLLETVDAMVHIDDWISLKGIDQIHIGLNDLHLQLGLKFMFELLSGGMIESLTHKIKQTGIPYGFGGVAPIGIGIVDSRLVLHEHHRLGSKYVILSRDFTRRISTDNSSKREDLLQNSFADIVKYNSLIESNVINYNPVSNMGEIRKIVNSYIYDEK